MKEPSAPKDPIDSSPRSSTKGPDTPRVVLFRGEDAEYQSHAALFARMQVDLTVFSENEDIASFRDSAGKKFDVIVLPLRLRGGTSAVSACLALKSDPVYSVVPIVVLSIARDRGVLESVYGAGADCVLVSPFDPDFVFYQINALKRLRRAVDEHVSELEDHFALRGAALTALNSINDGLIIIDSTGQPVFSNSAAAAIFGLELGPADSQAKKLLAQIEAALSINSANPVETVLYRADGRKVEVSLSAAALESSRGIPSGKAISLRDLADRRQISHMLAQGLRTRSLALLGTAGLINLMRQHPAGASGSALPFALKLLSSEVLSCPLNSVAVALVEVLDLLMGPSVELRIDIKGEHTLAVSWGDMFQLLGHMTLHAVESAGSGGETVISCEPKMDQNQFGERLTIVVSSYIHAEPRIVADPVISPLIRGTLFDAAQEGKKLSFGLDAAQEICEKYGAEIEYKRDKKQLKVRTNLPLVVG